MLKKKSKNTHQSIRIFTWQLSKKVRKMMLLMRLPQQDPYELEEQLRDELIMVHAMRNCLIMGMNFYNNFEDIDRLVSRIETG